MKGEGGNLWVIIIGLMLLISVFAVLAFNPSILNINGPGSSQATDGVGSEQLSKDPQIAEMIQQIDENKIRSTVNSLQNFTTRHYGTQGNLDASAYLHDRLHNITGLSVEYQGGELRNVIATLPGRDNESNGIFVVGAHYDSTGGANKNLAPGATDDGGGVAIVLELARIMSQYSFNHTVKFALWNYEEGGLHGSSAYVKDAAANHSNISSYLNFDSSCYDPENRFVLDIMYNDQSQWIADIMTQHNALYNIGFNLTYNVHKCSSDHKPFWDQGYTAVMTHSETHGPSHSPDDTMDKVSTPYAKKNGQLGLSVLARLAGVSSNDQ